MGEFHLGQTMKRRKNFAFAPVFRRPLEFLEKGEGRVDKGERKRATFIQTSDKVFRTLGGRAVNSPRLFPRSRKIRATLYLPAELLDEARNAAVYLAGYPLRLTLAKLAERALKAELQRLKEQYNEGRDFPPRTEELRGGRPIAA